VLPRADRRARRVADVSVERVAARELARAVDLAVSCLDGEGACARAGVVEGGDASGEAEARDGEQRCSRRTHRNLHGAAAGEERSDQSARGLIVQTPYTNVNPLGYSRPP